MRHPLTRIFTPISMIVFSAVIVVSTSMSGTENRSSIEPLVIATATTERSEITASRAYDVEMASQTSP